MRTKKLFKTWLAALALTLFAVGAQAKAVLDFSPVDSGANAERDTWAKYVYGATTSDNDSVIFSTGDFLTFGHQDKLKFPTKVVESCDDNATHDVAYEHNSTSIELSMTSTSAAKIEIWATNHNTNSSLIYAMYKNGVNYYNSSNGQSQNTERAKWYENGAFKGGMVDTLFSADGKEATFTFSNAVDASSPIQVKIQILNGDFKFDQGNVWKIAPTPSSSNRVCLKYTITGIDLKQGDKFAWRSPGVANIRYQRIVLSADASDGGDIPASSIETSDIPVKPVVGVAYTIKAKVLPSDAANKAYAWSIADGEEHVESFENGTILAKAADTVVVRAASVGTPSVFKDDTLVFVAYQKATALEITGIPTAAFTGETYPLSIAVTPADASFKAPVWSILKGANKASITAAGELKPTDTGTVVVRAMVIAPLAAKPDTTFTDSTIVVKPVMATSVEITGIPTTMVPGGQYLLGATVLPANTTFKSVAWTIDANTIGAEITEGGVISATAPGSVTVHATVSFGGVKADSTVTIVSQPVESVSVVGAPAYPINPSRGSVQLYADVQPENATNKNVEWRVVSGPGSIDEDGKLTLSGTEGTIVVEMKSKDNTSAIHTVEIEVSAAAVSVKQEILVVYENFGGNNKEGDIQPAAWPMLYNSKEAKNADYQKTYAGGAWRRTAPDSRLVYGQTEYKTPSEAAPIVTVPGMTDNPTRPGEIAGIGAVWTPSVHSAAFNIDTMKHYSGLDFAEYTFDAANQATEPFTYAVPLRNGYVNASAGNVRFGMQNIAVAPGFYSVPCYDTTLTPGGRFAIAVDASGWESSYEIPADSKTFTGCTNPDVRGYLQFGASRLGWKDAVNPGIAGTLTIPAEGKLSDVSKLEFLWSSAATYAALMVQVEYYDNDQLLQVDTLTYASTSHAFRNITLPIALDNNGQNSVRVKFSNPFSGSGSYRSSFMNFDYQFNDPATDIYGQATQTVAPHTFNRFVATTVDAAISSLRLYSLKVYAVVDAPGYELTLGVGATPNKSSGIMHGEKVSITADTEKAGKKFRGWRVSGMDDLTYTEKENPLELTITKNMTITPLYVGDVAVVPVVNEHFSDWEQVGVNETLTGDAAAGMIKMGRNIGSTDSAFAANGLSKTPVVKRMPLRYGFKTPAGEDFVDVTMKYVNVAPNATLRVHNVPGAEAYKGFLGFSSVADNDKGYIEIGQLDKIRKAVVQLSSPLVDNGGSWGANVRAIGQPSLAFFENDVLVRNVGQLRPHYATEAEIPLSGTNSKLTIGYANFTSWETLSRDRMGTPDTIMKGDTVIWGATIKGLLTSGSYQPAYQSGAGTTNNRVSSYAAMHSLKLYAEVTLPDFSSDATLNQLSITSKPSMTAPAMAETLLTFTQAFAPDTLGYTVLEERVIDSVVVIKAAQNDPNAMVAGDVGTKTLKPGVNIFTITVTAENGAVNAYTISVTRIVLSSNANLASLTASSVTLSPAFNPAVINYRGNVEGLTSTILTGVAADAKATVRGNGEKALAQGMNTFTITVVAEDTLVKKVYTLEIRRTGADATAVATEDYAVKVYPNPVVNGELTVEDSEWKEGAEIEVYDMSGVLAARYASTGEVTTLNVSRLPNGTYLLKVGKGRAATKFVKQ